MVDEINPRTGKPYSKNPRAQSARRQRNRRKSNAANQAENERVLQRQREEWEYLQEQKENEAIDVEDLKQQEDMKQGNYLESKKMDEIYAQDQAANAEFDRLVQEAGQLTGRAKAAKLKQAGRIKEGNTGMAISEVPGAAWGVAMGYADSMVNDPAAMSEHFIDLYADYQAAAKGAALMAPVPVPGARIAGAVGGVALRRGGKQWLKNMVDNVDTIFNMKRVHGPEFAGDARLLGNWGYKDLDNNPNVLMSKGISKGDGYSYRKGRALKNPIWENLSPKVQKGFTDAGIDSDKAAFFIEKWGREVGANVEGLPFTDSTFNFMKGELLPKILEDMKGIDLSDGLQLDHIAQLRAMAPFYQGRNLKQAEKIRRILIKEGIFGGHNPKNLKYLPTDVHTVKTNFWKQNVGDDGSKFFEGRSMKTYADVEKAAKEMKLFINRSNKIVETVSAQYKFMRKKKISAEELDKILKKVDLNYGTYNLKEVRKLIKEEINVDTLAKSKKGLEDAKAAAEAVEFKEKKTFLPYEIEDVDPADIPKKPRTRKKKSTLEKMAEKEFLKEHERIKKLGGQTELPLDE